MKKTESRRLGCVIVFKEGMTRQEIVDVFRGVDAKGRRVQDIIDADWLPQAPEALMGFDPAWGWPIWYVP